MKTRSYILALLSIILSLWCGFAAAQSSVSTGSSDSILGTLSLYSESAVSPNEVNVTLQFHPSGGPSGGYNGSQDFNMLLSASDSLSSVVTSVKMKVANNSQQPIWVPVTLGNYAQFSEVDGDCSVGSNNCFIDYRITFSKPIALLSQGLMFTAQALNNIPSAMTPPFQFSAAPAAATCIADGTNQCGCLQTNGENGLTWYADTSQHGKWSDWCSPTDPRCANTGGAALNAFNSAGHCGYSDWHLPSMPNASTSVQEYIDQAGGEWDALSQYALLNGWSEGDSLIGRLAEFSNEQEKFYWARSSTFNNNAFGVYFAQGLVQTQSIPQDGYVILVRGGSSGK